jgi:hypothetical protein
MGVRKLVVSALLVCSLLLAAASQTSAQVNTVNLSGTVLDPQNLAVKQAKLTMQDTNLWVCLPEPIHSPSKRPASQL